MRQEGDHGKQRQDQRRLSRDGLVIPLALGLHTQMGSGFLKGGLDLPALDEKGQHLVRGQGQIGGQKGLGIEFSLGIFDQQPSDGHRG